MGGKRGLVEQGEVGSLSSRTAIMVVTARPRTSSSSTGVVTISVQVVGVVRELHAALASDSLGDLSHGGEANPSPVFNLTGHGCHTRRSRVVSLSLRIGIGIRLVNKSLVRIGGICIVDGAGDLGFEDVGFGGNYAAQSVNRHLIR